MKGNLRRLPGWVPALLVAVPFSNCSASRSQPQGTSVTSVNPVFELAAGTPAATVASGPMPNASSLAVPAAVPLQSAAAAAAAAPESSFHAWINYDFEPSVAGITSIPENPEVRYSPPEDLRVYVPIDIYDLKSTIIATDGVTIGLLRDGAFEQDALYSRRQEFGRNLVGFGGQWPKSAWALRGVADEAKHRTTYELFRWTTDIWSPQQVLKADAALLGGDGTGSAVLVQGVTQSGKQTTQLRYLDGPVLQATPGEANCGSRLIQPRQLQLNRHGDILLLGKDCANPQRDLLEHWQKNKPHGQILPIEAREIAASALDEKGQVWVATSRENVGLASVSSIARFSGGTWSSVADLTGSVISMALTDNKLWAIAQLSNTKRSLLRWLIGNEWETVDLPVDVGEPNWVKNVGGRFWVSTKHTLLSADAPPFTWDWEAVTFVQPITYAPKRLRRYCPSELTIGVTMAIIVGQGPRIDVEHWGKILEQARTTKCERYRGPSCVGAKWRAPNGREEQQVPLLAREGSMYYFGFMTTNRYTADSLYRGYSQIIRAPLNLCATPISFSYGLIMKVLHQRPVQELRN